MKTLNVLLEITVYSGILFCTILLLKLCFKNRMSPFLHLLVWGLLLARLLLPVTLESTVHIIVLPAQTGNATVQQIQAQADNAGPSPIIHTASQIATIEDTNTQTDNKAQPAAAVQSAAPVQTNAPLSTEDILLYIWLAGVCIGIAYLTALYGLLLRRIKKNTQAPSQRLLALFAQVKAELNIRQDVRMIGQCEHGTPAVLFPRTVLMPVYTLVSMSDEEVRLVLRHELMHIKRGDHILSLVLSLLNAIYWFNPVVWIASRLIRADMETACDSDVVRHFSGDEKSIYASVILSLFSKKQYGNLALGMVQGNTRQIAEKRIRGVFMSRTSNKKVKMASALLAGLLLFACFTTACQPTPEKPFVISKQDNPVEEAVKANATADATEIQKSKNALAEEIQKLGAKLKMDFKPNKSVTIKVDAKIAVPEYKQLPMVRVQPKNFSKEQFDTWAKLLTDGAPLYVVSNRGPSLSKEEISAMLIRLQGYALNKNLPNYVKNGLKGRIEMLKEEAADANSKADEKLYDGALVKAGENKSFKTITQLKSYMGKEIAAELSLWQSISGTQDQMQFDINDLSATYNTFEPYTGMDGKNIKLSYKEAKEKAEEFVRKLDGENSNLVIYESSVGYQIDTYAGYTKETSPQAYAFKFARSYDGVTAKKVNYLHGVNQDVDYSKQVSPELFFIVIDDQGVRMASWQDPAKTAEKVADDVPLKSFESIKDIFTQYCKQKFTWVPVDDALGPNLTATLNVKRVELNLMTIPEKDNLQNYITVPVWDFIGDMKYDGKKVAQDGYPAYELQDISILTINAMDGAVIDREQGY
jgi:beta-lactamase regulating signal transducer with metallopeptidase domain